MLLSPTIVLKISLNKYIIFIFDNTSFMANFIYFIFYSFIGFVFETVYTLITKGIFKMKKCFLFNFLCPVYGIGALVIIFATRKFKNNKLLTFIIGTICSTLTELVFGIFYTSVLNTRIWNYNDIPISFSGHISLIFSLMWGVLSIILVYYVHPFVENKLKITTMPKPIYYSIFLFIIIDILLSCFFLKKYKTQKALSLGWLINH